MEQRAKNIPKFVLTGFSLVDGKQFSREVSTLDDVRESGQYTVVGRNVSESEGLPPAKYCDCRDCYIEAQLIVTRNSSSLGEIEKENIGQSLTLSNKEDGVTNTYQRSWSKQQDKATWSEWQIIATGSIEAITDNNNVNKNISSLSKQISTELQRATEAETAIVKTLNAVPTVERGGMNDSTGAPVENNARCRCVALPRKAIARQVLTKPKELSIWLQMLDEDKKLITTVDALWGWSEKSAVDVYSLNEKCVYLNFIFKRADGGEITDSDITTAKAYIADITSDYQYLRDYRISYNNVATPMRISEGKLFIDPNGFGVTLKNKTYYVADASKKMTEPYTFDFNTISNNAFLALDTTQLVTTGVRTELSSVVRIVEQDSIKPTDIVIAYYYLSVKALRLCGQFEVLFGASDYITELQDYNVTKDNISILGNTIAISGNGFLLISRDGVRYYVGYVAGKDSAEQKVLSATVSEARTYAYINMAVLKSDARISFSEAFVTSVKTLGNGYALFAAWENGVLVPNGLIGDIVLKNTTRNRGGMPHVEIGGFDDGTGLPTTNSKRCRCSCVARKDIRSAILDAPEGLDVWVQELDENFILRGVVNTLWYSPKTPIIVASRGDDIAYFNFIFKRTDGGEMTSEDMAAAKEYLCYHLFRNAQSGEDSGQMRYELRYNNLIAPIRITNKKVFIDPNGFGVIMRNATYYVADVTREMTEPYVFEFLTKSCFLVLDSTKLTTPEVRTELSEAVVVRDIPLATDIVIAYNYFNESIVLVGAFKDMYEAKPCYNDEVLFSPEFYAYKKGRRNDAAGVGTGWYNRFRIAHISDTHCSWDSYQEALSVSNGKMNVVVNTGDEANGRYASDAEAVKGVLSRAARLVGNCSKVPYMQIAGNHDITGLTKEDFFSRICATIQTLTPRVVWGNAAGKRTYGYIDFTDAEYEGNFRVIMLDAADYDDGLFESVYPFASVVFSQEQIDWLIDVLLDAADKGLHVFTMMHYSFGDAEYYGDDVVAFPDAEFQQDPFLVPDIIDAIQNKGQLAREYPDKQGRNNVVVNRNFGAAGNLDFVAHLFGHIHSKNHYRCQKADGSKKYDILMLGETSLGMVGTAVNKCHREALTINGISFSALEVDVVEKAVYRVAYGAYLNYDKSNSERTTKIPYRFDK
ncbi:MAG: metallophosphoesterase [Bacteroidaceae bacterium]|nr:metallophosphoesterase [Bacteroidaceae bacterium]